MCLAFAGVVEEIDEKKERALINFGSVRRWVSVLLTPGVKKGDKVMVHAGFAIDILREDCNAIQP